MKPEHICANHPNEEAVSVCHHCGEWFCSPCLREGPEYYYCGKSQCIQALEVATSLQKRKCPSCGESINEGAYKCGFCGKQLRELTESEKTEDLILVARYKSSVEAHLACSKLESEEIESYIADEHMVTINPAFYAFGGVKLQVKKSDFNRAVRILGLDEPVVTKNEKKTPSEKMSKLVIVQCSHCGEKNEMKEDIKFCSMCGKHL
jgi:hypothetical protein